MADQKGLRLWIRCGLVSKQRRAKGAEFKQVPIPKITDNQVLIKVKAASICGTDKHIYNWDAWAQGRLQSAADFRP